MRMSRSKFARASVHDLCKCFHAACIITGQTSGHVVWAFHEQRLEQIDSLIRVARLDIKFHRVGHGIDCLNSNRLIQKTALSDDQSRKQFLDQPVTVQTVDTMADPVKLNIKPGDTY